MSEAKNYVTAPEDRISFSHKFVYGLGALCNQLLTAGMSVMAIILNLGLHMNPALVGYIMAIPRFSDAITDPIMGYVTDRTKSKMGRRRPYILVGAILSGVIFIFMWQIPRGLTETGYFIFFTIFFILFYIAYTIYATPFIALGYEMTPDYHERTKLMSMSNTVGQFAWTITPWFYVILWNRTRYTDFIDAASELAIWVGIFIIIAGILPAIIIKERFYKIAKSEDEQDKKVEKKPFSQEILLKFQDFFKSFYYTIKNPHFLKLCAAMFLIFNGFQMIAGLAPYNIIYYMFKGNDQLASKFMCWFFTVSSLMTCLVIPLISKIATKIGKQKAFYVSTSISIFGYILKWFCYEWSMKYKQPYILFIPTLFIGFGLGGLFTLVGAMMADVCDHDELINGHRREGTFGAINWWIVKLGMAVAFAVSGHILNISGFDVTAGWIQPDRTLYLMRLFEIGIPIISSILAILVISRYTLTIDKVLEIRAELEKRRGKSEATE